MKTKELFDTLMNDAVTITLSDKNDVGKVVSTMRVYLRRWEARLTKFGLDFDSQYVRFNWDEGMLTMWLISRSSAEFQEFINSRSILDYNVVVKFDPTIDELNNIIESIDAT